MSEWWEGLNLLQQVLYCIAIPSTLIMLIQTVLILIGIGSHGAGIDFSDTSGLDLGDIGDVGDIGDIGDLSDIHSSSVDDIGVSDGSAPGDFAIANIFTFQGVVVFLAMFGWVSITAISLGLDGKLSFIAIVIGLIVGFLCMVGIAMLIRASAKLNQNGTLIMNNLLGKTGQVYLTIPEKGSGFGKVNITIDERFLELGAVTDEEKALSRGSEVRVIDIRGDNLVVESID